MDEFKKGLKADSVLLLLAMQRGGVFSVQRGNRGTWVEARRYSLGRCTELCLIALLCTEPSAQQVPMRVYSIPRNTLVLVAGPLFLRLPGPVEESRGLS